MVLDKNKNLKLYYSIREVSQMFNVNESALRYWETMFPRIRPKTSPTGVRQYTEEEIEEIRVIHNLVKVRGYRLAAAKKMINANPHAVDKSTAILESLISAREELKELKKQFDQLV